MNFVFFLKNFFTLNFPHGKTPAMVKMIKFHEKCLFIVFFVLIIVLSLLFFSLKKKFSLMKNFEKETLEMSWTVIPTLIVLGLMIPSLELLYFTEESGGVFFKKNMKVIGHQWYWSYESNCDKEPVSFDSYLMKDKNLNLGEFRNCEVDCPMIFYVKTATRLLMSSADSIHSWAVPEFGVKIDAIPGRLNQVTMFTSEVGRFFGFCSELCGVNHSFMPMIVEVLKKMS